MRTPMSALSTATARIGTEPHCIQTDPDERSPVLEQVEKVITAIRPAIQADEGDIELVSVDEATGVVTVELMGACVTCPASTQTLKAGIERIMKDRVDGVTEVVEVNALGMSESPVQL
jgi:Fe-S cluster biogenesis protein NfuA